MLQLAFFLPQAVCCVYELLRCLLPFTTRKFTVFQFKSMQFVLRYKAFAPPCLAYHLPPIPAFFCSYTCPLLYPHLLSFCCRNGWAPGQLDGAVIILILPGETSPWHGVGTRWSFKFFPTQVFL